MKERALQNLPEQIDWRVYFQKREYHNILSAAVLDLLKRVLAVGKHGGLISDTNYTVYVRRLDIAKNEDLSQVYQLFYLDCEIDKLIRGKSICKLIWLLRAVESEPNEFATEHLDKIKFLSWRLREVEVLCKFLKEARNAQAHDNNARQQLGWLIAIPSNIIRLLEICPINKTMPVQIRELIATCKSHLSQALSPLPDSAIVQSGNGQAQSLADTSDESQTMGLDVIEEKLDIVLAVLNSYGSVRANQPVQNVAEDPPENAKIGLDDEPDSLDLNSYPVIEYLTPSMVREELSKLGQIFEKSKGPELISSPNESLMQVAIIEEIINNQPSIAQEIVGLPDVEWRFKRYSVSMQLQLVELEGQIQDILNRAVWE